MPAQVAGGRRSVRGGQWQCVAQGVSDPEVQRSRPLGVARLRTLEFAQAQFRSLAPLLEYFDEVGVGMNCLFDMTEPVVYLGLERPELLLEQGAHHAEQLTIRCVDVA